jgi:hypothetical protein
MIRILSELERQIRPTMDRAGFVLAYDGGLDISEGDGMLMVEYRRVTQDQRCLRLDFCQLAAGTIAAELWSPAALADMGADATVEDVAIRRRVWQYDHSESPTSFARTIITEVTSWLESISRE